MRSYTNYTPFIKCIGNSILRSDYDALYTFFRKVWEKPHAYVVLIARRCLNLNEIFLRVHSSLGKTVFNAESIISNSALLFYADEITEYYLNWNCFPSILVVDDMIYHGRGIMNLLHSLEELVITRLQERLGTTLSKNEAYYVHRDLAAAVDIYAFCVNRQPLLIDELYLQKLRMETSRYTSELRKLSQRISSFLQHAGEPNTSYALSYNFDPQGSLHPENWTRQSWSYRGAKQTIFSCTYGHHYASHGFLPTVRLYQGYEDHLIKDRNLTGLAIFGETDIKAVDGICARLTSTLKEYELSKQSNALKTVYRILALQSPLYQKLRVQFLSLLMSAICVRSFLGDLPPQDFSLYGDTVCNIEKIARNFARKQDIQQELIFLLEQTSLWDQVEAILCGGFRQSARPFLTDSSEQESISPKDAIKEINSAVESIFYKIGMRSESSAWEAVDGRKRFYPHQAAKDVISLNGYLEKVNRLRLQRRDIPESGSLCCMLAQMDNGLISMNVELSPQNSEDRSFASVGCVLKAGELATFVLPRRYHMFISALAFIERNAWQLDSDRQSAVLRFIESLPENPPSAEGNKTKFPEFLDTEYAAYQELKDTAFDFVSRLYECGQSLNGWDIPLMTADDWEESGKGSYLSFVEHNRERQEAYRTLAEAFLADFGTSAPARQE